MKAYKKTTLVQVQNLAQSIRAATGRKDIHTPQVRAYAVANGIKSPDVSGKYQYFLGEDAERIRAAFIAGEDAPAQEPEVWDEAGLLAQFRVIREELEKFGWHITATL